MVYLNTSDQISFQPVSNQTAQKDLLQPFNWKMYW